MYSREFWYKFFSDLGFLIMPCGFNYHSTTYWLFHAEAEDEQALKDETFKISNSGIHCFFYQISATMLKENLALFRLTDILIRRKLAQEKLQLTIPSSYDDYILPNLRKYERKQYLQGFSLRAYMYMLSAIADQIDPMDRQENEILQYLSDFDTYGLCFLMIAKRNKD